MIFIYFFIINLLEQDLWKLCPAFICLFPVVLLIYNNTRRCSLMKTLGESWYYICPSSAENLDVFCIFWNFKELWAKLQSQIDWHKDGEEFCRGINLWPEVVEVKVSAWFVGGFRGASWEVPLERCLSRGERCLSSFQPPSFHWPSHYFSQK